MQVLCGWSLQLVVFVVAPTSCMRFSNAENNSGCASFWSTLSVSSVLTWKRQPYSQVS
jgi:hypothetical protein